LPLYGATPDGCTRPHDLKERFAMHINGAPLALAVAAPPWALCLPVPAYELTVPSTRSTTP
jgi:hypothetical protein